MQKILPFILFLLTSTIVKANYATPGTGVKWTLNDLVTNSGGDVTFSSGAYFINDTIFISQNDTLQILADATVKFMGNTYLDVNGTLIIDPPTSVTFTAADIATRYLGVRIDSSSSTILRKLTFEYGNSLRLFDCSPIIDSCIFRYNNPVTTFGNGTVSLNRASPIITNSQFLDNQRAAIQGGANIANAPQIINCLFLGNNTLNGNVPQINLGATGSDTVRILNNQILRASTNSGGIGFLPLGNVFAIISGNTIRNNRYGITFNGGANINAVISYNVIDSNNTQNDPNLGGSGISFSGGSATSQQNSIVKGNTIRYNLWGVTIQGRSRPNLGNLQNADTTDDGRNYFIGNTNATTPGIDLYNNTIDTIMAQGNYWGTDDSTEVEARIFHKPDNNALGLVIWSGNITLPVTLLKFSGVLNNKNVVLKWQTANESNSSVFEVQRSRDGNSFETIGTIQASGYAVSTRTYNFTDANLPSQTSILYYRLKQVDKDSRFSFSNIIPIKTNTTRQAILKVFPTLIYESLPVHMEIFSEKDQLLSIQVYDATGQLIYKTQQTVYTGRNVTPLPMAEKLAKGINHIRLQGETLNETISLVKQ